MPNLAWVFNVVSLRERVIALYILALDEVKRSRQQKCFEGSLPAKTGIIT